MQEFPGFCGPAYQSRSWKASAQRCLNLYLEQDPEKSGVLYGTPGMVLANTLRTSAQIDDWSVRAMLATPGVLAIVTVGDEGGNGALFQATGVVYTASGPVLTGLLSQGFGSFGVSRISLTQGGDKLLLSYGNAAIAGTIGGPMAPVASPNFPANPRSVTFIDGYFVTHGLVNPGRIQWSAPFDPTSWDALNFASASNLNDSIQRVYALNRILYIVGTLTTECWAVTGGVETFTRIASTFIPYGTPAWESVAEINSSLFFLAQDRFGGRLVLQADGLQTSRVSTHAIEKEISGYPVVSDAYAFGYQQEGHAFYVLTFPTARKTWVYDASTQLWHERNTQDPDLFSGRTESYWSARCGAYFGGVNWVGHGFPNNSAGARLYELRLGWSQDAVGPIRRLRSSPHVFDNAEYRTLSALEFAFQTGVGSETGATPEQVNPQALLRISKDGGQTYAYQNSAPLGRQGKYATRTRFNRCGRARDFIAELSLSAPVPIALTGAYMEIT